MINKKNKRGEKFLVALLFSIFLFPLVSAFSTGFVSSNVELHSGQIYNERFSLSNPSEVEITIEAVIQEGGEYLVFTEGTVFDVPAKGSVAAPVRISIPDDAEVGDTYPIKVLFQRISDIESDDSMIGLTFNQEQDVSVTIIPKPGEEVPPEGISTTWIILGIVLIIIVIVLIWFVNKSKKPDVKK